MNSFFLTRNNLFQSSVSRFYLSFLLLALGGVFLLPSESFACHKGGPMGFASRNPSGLTVDVTSAPSSSSSSTSGGMECKDWEFTAVERVHFLEAQWELLSEEAAQGQGTQLAAFSQIMGCTEQAAFGTLIQNNYTRLFEESETNSAFKQPEILLLKVENLLKQHTELACTL